MKKYALTMLLACLALAPAVPAQPAPKHEFRGAWIATVTNLDWPWTNDVAQQKADLVAKLDALKAAGINAVMFQIRTEADAFYASSLEPWSRWLTGEQGKAPDPFYDPLAFAIEEAHKRGMELHAWFNPYRAVRGSGYPQAANHVSVARPEWILTFAPAAAGLDSLKIINPGIPAARSYIADVVMDVVNRYDVDGVHFDDYFYPYPPNEIRGEDVATFNQYRGPFNDINVWRKYNINMFVREVGERIRASKPWVKYGISPFGIWKSGVPAGINGLSAVDVLHADALVWLQEQWLDYLTPQLYWPFGGGQDYGKLAPWWASMMNGRHLYPGLALYRNYTTAEVPNQIRFNRAHPDIQGSVLFRTGNVLANSNKVTDSLRTNLYHRPALTPTMPWKSLEAPSGPSLLLGEIQCPAGGPPGCAVQLTWQPPVSQVVPARRYAVYRVATSSAPDWSAATQDPANLIAVTGETQYRDVPAVPGDYYYAITSVSANSVESPVRVSYAARRVSVGAEEAEAPAVFVLQGNYPNPFNPATEIRFTLREAGRVTLRVFDVTGREVALLLDEAPLAAGAQAVAFEAEALPSGTYVYRLEAGGRSAAGTMTLLK